MVGPIPHPWPPLRLRLPPAILFATVDPTVAYYRLMGGYTTPGGMASFMRSRDRQAARRDSNRHKKRSYH